MKSLIKLLLLVSLVTGLQSCGKKNLTGGGGSGSGGGGGASSSSIEGEANDYSSYDEYQDDFENMGFDENARDGMIVVHKRYTNNGYQSGGGIGISVSIGGGINTNYNSGVNNHYGPCYVGAHNSPCNGDNYQNNYRNISDAINGNEVKVLRSLRRNDIEFDEVFNRGQYSSLRRMTRSSLSNRLGLNENPTHFRTANANIVLKNGRRVKARLIEIFNIRLKYKRVFGEDIPYYKTTVRRLVVSSALPLIANPIAELNGSYALNPLKRIDNFEVEKIITSTSTIDTYRSNENEIRFRSSGVLEIRI